MEILFCRFRKPSLFILGLLAFFLCPTTGTASKPISCDNHWHCVYADCPKFIYHVHTSPFYTNLVRGTYPNKKNNYHWNNSFLLSRQWVSISVLTLWKSTVTTTTYRLSFLKNFPAISGLISNSQRSIRHYALAFKTTSLCSTPHHTPSIYYNLTPLFSIKTQFNLDTIYKKNTISTN